MSAQMPRRFKPRWLSRKRSLFNLVRSWADDNFSESYAAWLIKNGGRPMYRAISKALDRHAQSKPDRLRAARVHASYRRRWRR